MIVLLVLLSCAKETPAHLRVDSTRPARVSAVDPAERLLALIRRDPLVRRPKPGPPGTWQNLPDGAAIEAWAMVARQPNPTPSDWTEVESRWAGTIAVPLTRGARLAAIEVSMTIELEVDAQRAVAGWLGATRIEADPTTQNPAEPMDWVPGSSPKQKREATLRMAERSVLLGWLDGPQLSLQSPALALSAGTYSRLANTPAGALLRARATDERDAGTASQGLLALKRATELALAEASADTDAEQEAYREQLTKEQTIVGDKPTGAWLARARHGLTADAGNPNSAGLALVAIAAERIMGTCPDGACMGLERTQSLKAALRWSPHTASLVHAWQVVAVKRALDTLEVAHATASFGRTIPIIAEVLSGTGGGPVEQSLLRYRRKEPTALIQLSRLAGGAPSADIDGTIIAVRHRLIETCNAALSVQNQGPIAALIHRIGTRAALPLNDEG